MIYILLSLSLSLFFSLLCGSFVFVCVVCALRMCAHACVWSVEAETLDFSELLPNRCSHLQFH